MRKPLRVDFRCVKMQQTDLRSRGNPSVSSTALGDRDDAMEVMSRQKSFAFHPPPVNHLSFQ